MRTPLLAAALLATSGCISFGAKPPPSLKPIPLELGDSLRDIGDPELRTVLESLARSLSNSETPTPAGDDL